MLSVSTEGHVVQGGMGCVSVFSSVKAAGHSRLMQRLFLPMFLSPLPAFRIGMISLCAIFHVSVQLRLKMLVR